MPDFFEILNVARLSSIVSVHYSQYDEMRFQP